VKAKWSAVWQAASGIKSPQLRTMGTVGGELLQRPRCWYFRHGRGLCAELNGESLPAKGDNRYHAVFGNSGPAKFVNASSLAPALIACGATVTVTGPKGARTIPAKDLYATPKSAAERELTLAADEIVTSIGLQGPASKSATYEVRPRQGLDWPLATASVALELDGAKVKAARIVLGHVAPTPWPADAAEKELVGKELNDKTIAAAAGAAVAGATPLSKNAYKVDLAKVAVRRALAAAAGV
jgi:xanthine dehydrogenase YagS FAD-binding subunit